MIPVIDLSDKRDDSERTTEQDVEPQTQPQQVRDDAKPAQERAPTLGPQRRRRSLLNRLRHTRLGCWLIRRGWLMPSWDMLEVGFRAMLDEALAPHVEIARVIDVALRSEGAACFRAAGPRHVQILFVADAAKLDRVDADLSANAIFADKISSFSHSDLVALMATLSRRTVQQVRVQLEVEMIAEGTHSHDRKAHN